MSAKEAHFRDTDVEGIRRATADLKKLAADLNSLPSNNDGWGDREEAAKAPPPRAPVKPKENYKSVA